MEILLVEDEVRIASLIQRGLEDQGYKMTLAYDGLMGKKLALSHPFDLIIMDVILPKINGIDLCKEIRQVQKDIPIILLTALGTTDDKLEGFDAGADDYIVKPFDFRELEARIRTLLKRKQNSQQSTGMLLTYSNLEMNGNTMTVSRNGIPINLTPKEYKLLEFMVRNKERVLSRAEIADKVWNLQFDTGTNFIDVYINYLRKKLDKDFNPKLIHTRTGLGFIFKADENKD